MNIPKAIEILDDFRRDPNAFFTDDLPDAIKLGIEALKRIQYQHINISESAERPLPGEDVN